MKTALIVFWLNLLAKHRSVEVWHPQYSKHLSPCLFPKWKIYLESKKFEDVEDIKNLTEQLLTTSKLDFKICYDQWKIHWNKFIECQLDNCD